MLIAVAEMTKLEELVFWDPVVCSQLAVAARESPSAEFCCTWQSTRHVVGTVGLKILLQLFGELGQLALLVRQWQQHVVGVGSVVAL
jgi:hypothetical protein